MATILDQILQQAQATSTPVVPVVVPDATTAFDGTRIAPTDEFTLPVAPLGKSLYSFQLAAVETILNHRRVILGLQPGMGKTAVLQAVAAAEAALGQRTIVSVPPSLRVSPWAQDFASDYPHLKVVLVEGQKQADIEDADVVIVGDSVLSHRVEDLKAWGAVNLFADEAHRFKSRTAKRSTALLELADSLPARGIVCLATGTVAVNNAGDLYVPIRTTGTENATAVSGGPSWTRYMDAWCETEMVWTGRANVKVVVGCKDAPGLRARLVETCMVSVPRDEVLDLPERTFAVRDLVLNGDAAEYRRIERDFLAWVRAEKGDAAAKRAAKAEAISMLMKLWEADGIAKAKATAEYVSSLVEQGEQVVLMGWHQSVLLKLTGILMGEGISVDAIVGGMTSEAKADVVAKFQAGGTQVVLGQIEAAGTGITLHAAHHLVFAQLPWSPSSFTQASDRVYRIGQNNAVTVHVLNGQDMVSQKLWDVLQGKALVVDAINHGKPTTVDPDSVITQVLAGFGW